MNFKPIVTIWKKEIRDTVRDRRTLVSMILVPMLMMPLITVGMFKLIETQTEKQAATVAKVVLAGAENAPEIAQSLRDDPKLEIVAPGEDPRAAVSAGEVDAAVVIPADFSDRVAAQENADLQLLSKSTNLNATNALVEVSRIVADYNQRLLEQRFAAQQINPAILSKVVLVPEDAATEKELGGFVLGLLIPLFIVMWAIVGGQYTAIDVSAGEKERKTLEALLLTPVKRIDIVLGKFLAVSTVALTSIVTAIGSLYLSFLYAGDLGVALNGNTGAVPLAAAPSMSFSIEPAVALLLFGVSIFLVLMFSAIILSISIYAKSFKEAQSYIGPAYILVILPVALVNAVPGFEPTTAYFVIPAVNAILLFKELLMGTYDPTHILLTFISLIVCSALAILVATRIYSKESVLFKD